MFKRPMWRNLLAIICGIITFWLVFRIALLLEHYKIVPITELDRFEGDTFLFSLIWMNFLICPVNSFITGLIVGLVAKTRVRLLAIISILPFILILGLIPMGIMIIISIRGLPFFFSPIISFYLTTLGARLSYAIKVKKVGK